MRRKFILIILSLLTVISLTACEEDFNADKYIGEGLKTTLGLIVDANQRYYNDIFVMGRLDYDVNQTVEKDGKTYALVTDKIYNSYDYLEQSLNDVYIEQEAERILKEYDILFM